MASDVFVYWTTEDRPTRAQVDMVIRDFFGDVAIDVRWHLDRFFVTLFGKWSTPLVRVVDPDIRQRLLSSAPEPPDDGRYIEVWFADDSLDVITRRQDDFTHACQVRLAEVFARRWKGRVER